MCCGEKIKSNNISTSKKYCKDCEEKFKCCGCGLVSASHAEHLIHFEENVWSGKIINKGCPNCLFTNYWWDTINNTLVLKSKVWNFDEKRYKLLTRERLKQIEVCSTIST